MNLAVRILLTTLTLMVLTTGVAFAGSPHFVGACTKTQDENTLTVHCKEAGPRQRGAGQRDDQRDRPMYQ
jgi:hypothetical protein